MSNVRESVDWSAIAAAAFERKLLSMAVQERKLYQLQLWALQPGSPKKPQLREGIDFALFGKLGQQVGVGGFRPAAYERRFAACVTRHAERGEAG